MKKRNILPIVILMCSVLFCACSNSGESMKTTNADKNEENRNKENAESTDEEADTNKKVDNGYDLPIDASQRKEAEDDCKKMMELIHEIYIQADKGDALNIVLSDETISEMQNKLKKTNNPVITTDVYANMDNFENVDRFLRECIKGVSGSTVIYEIHSGGGIGRRKFIFDGADMYVLSVSAGWNEESVPDIVYASYTRIKEWKYTDKGWFCYELCVPEYPEVTEMVDGNCMLRVKPMTDENREMSEKCVLGLAYQGNNILCSNWNAESMKDLDYNGVYEYLYVMKYQEAFEPENYPNGIPKEAFENLIMEYLPITEEKIQKYAVFDKKNQTYVWERLGCFNYSPTYFGTSVPEVTGVRENKDGTVTLTVDAVCSMILCDDAVITHELTIQFAEDGSFQYLGNKILDDGISNIPEYQYRIIRE